VNVGRLGLDRVFGWTAGGRTATKPINLALQGGGAHGAFTWGVLDALLADGRLSVQGISGASAGAMNAAVLADGLTRAGPDEARARLAEFWRETSRVGKLPELQRQVFERLFSAGPRGASPTRAWLDAMARLMSPYDVNPLNINLLKDVVERVVDFEAVRRNRRLELFLSATEVQTGQLRIFRREEITAEVVLASACLPFLFRAVEIDGRAYWDGGYVGNPVLFPFVHATGTEDVVIVQINPLLREDVPTTSSEIMSRAHEITFNAPLLAELRGIAFVSRLIDEGRLPRGFGPNRYRRLRIHRIALEARDNRLDTASKLSTHAEHFETLFSLGQQAAREFLAAHFDDIGSRGTVDLEEQPTADRRQQSARARS
jgi:NTE family protein